MTTSRKLDERSKQEYLYDNPYKNMDIPLRSGKRFLTKSKYTGGREW